MIKNIVNRVVDFFFNSPFDTYVLGLHRRTRDLHSMWKQKGIVTAGDDARSNAVEEMLLRLRWDDRDTRARTSLSRIVARIWDGLEGIVTQGDPIPSALWICDESSDEKQKQKVIKSNTGDKSNGETTADSDDWDVV